MNVNKLVATWKYQAVCYSTIIPIASAVLPANLMWIFGNEHTCIIYTLS